MHYFKDEKPELIQRGVAALCYVSCGLIGLIYTLFGGRYRNTPFFRFHFLQSIIIGIFTYLLSWMEAIIRDILGGIFGLIIGLLPMATGFLTGINLGIGLLLVLINKIAFFLMIYGFIWALLGKYAEIPGLSKLVRRQI